VQRRFPPGQRSVLRVALPELGSGAVEAGAVTGKSVFAADRSASQQGLAAGAAWAEKTAAGCRANYEAIDGLVQTYYQEKPERFLNVPSRLQEKFERWSRANPKALEPSKAFRDSVQKELGVPLECNADQLRVLAAMESGGVPRRSARGYMAGYSSGGRSVCSSPYFIGDATLAIKFP
jgi:hypothetical protein